MTSKKTDRIYAALGTAALLALLAVTLVMCSLKFPPDGMEWPPSDAPEIVLEEVEDLYADGEFVRMGDDFDLPYDAEPLPSAETSPEPTQSADAPANAGKPTPDTKPQLTSRQPSEAKTETKPQGPTKEELEARAQEAKRQQEARENAANATARAFGGGNGSGTAGRPDGNTDAAGAAVEGSAGSGVRGRSLESWRKVSSTKLGVISVRVKVDAAGRVTSATYDAAGSKGAVAADLTMRNRCVAESHSCRFSVLEGSPVQSGTIIWTFK